MSGVAVEETIDINLGKASKSACLLFDKFTAAFQGNVMSALDFLILKNVFPSASFPPEPKQDLILKVKRRYVDSVHRVIDAFVSKHMLLSGAYAVEILVRGSGVKWEDDGVLKLTAPHSVQLMEKLRQGRLEKNFCDVEIVAGEPDSSESFSAHKCVLAASSEFFADLLKDDTKFVRVCGLKDPSKLGQILEFIYTGAVTLNKDNSSQIFQMAEYLSIKPLERLCEEYFMLSHEVLKLDELSEFAIEAFDEASLQKSEEHTLEDSEKPNRHILDPTPPAASEKDGATLPQLTNLPLETKTIVAVTRHVKRTSKRASNRACVSHFICQLCQAVFKSKSNLKRHMISHSGERKHCCTTCGKLFLKADHLTRHEYTHSTERPFDCEKCEKKFKTKDNLKRHLLTHTEERPFCCEICAKTFKDKSALVVHQKSHNRTEVVCHCCGKRFTQQNRLAYHMLQHTQPPSCATCGKSFKFPTQLQRHMKTHTGDRPFSCETCGRQFIDSHSLKLHQRKHSGVGLHSCPRCSREFLDKYHLTRHMKMHTGEKPFKCDSCQKLFSRADNCESHRKSCVVKAAMQKQTQSFVGQEERNPPHDVTQSDRAKGKDRATSKRTQRAVKEIRQITGNFSLAVDASEIDGRRFRRIAKKPPELKLVLVKKGGIVHNFGSNSQSHAPASNSAGQSALIQIVQSPNVMRAENTPTSRSSEDGTHAQS